MNKSSVVQTPAERKIATAEDVRAYAESQSWGAPEAVPLPHSGLVVLLRKPTRFYDALRRANWPEELRAKVDAADSSEELAGQLTPEEVEIILADRREKITRAFVKPQVSLKPDCNQFHWDFFPDEDKEFILKYLRGQVDASGVDLEAFRKGQPGVVGGGGAVSQPLPGTDATAVSGASHG